ncbi:hypothetical protein [Paraliomyxa miuraensis]|uniref:hypothetical protein n=1 Tax=Paraliomyxa miuraensis TaxID=376150 RepID=UPI002255CAD0|nr:hypothetical protein [Paraliomyxa miuraensis]MCX4244988.1 hypothetical protein [Paraliomyxa miuraensis]
MLVGWLASATGCVLYEDAGPTSTELYALIQSHCQSATACSCGWTGYDEDACVPELETRWKARLSEGQRRELVYDPACMALITETIERYACYWPGGSTPLCTDFCAVFHGSRAEGEPCGGDDPLISDCAQGLACHDGECAAPCDVLGGRAQGETCGNDMLGPYDDCASGLWCSWATGRCEPAAELGESCDYGSCAAGLQCSWRTNTCMAPPGEGQPCDDLDCAEGLYCEWSYESGTTACQRFATEGEPCDQRPCAQDLHCNDYSRCVVAPGVGESCLWGVLCSDDSVCDPDQVRCVERPEAGAACISGSCALGAWCSTTIDDPIGTCMAPQENGQMCAGHPQCQSRYCPNGFCQPAPAEGESCEDTLACGPGLVCNGTTCETTLTRGPAACGYPGW